MKPPTITTQISCKDQGKYLQEAIDSVMAQTFKPVQIILIDDGSSDHTLSVMKKNADKDKRFLVVRHESPLGNIRSFNHAIDLTKGDFFHLMAADDRLSDKHFYEDATLILLQNPRIAFVSIGLQWMNEDGSLRSEQSLPPVAGEMTASAALEFMKLTKSNFTNGGGTLIRTSVQREIGYYDPKFKYSADWVNWIRVFGQGYSAHYFQKPGYLYRRSSSQMTHNRETPMHERIGCLQEIDFAIVRGKDVSISRNR